MFHAKTRSWLVVANNESKSWELVFTQFEGHIYENGQKFIWSFSPIVWVLATSFLYCWTALVGSNSKHDPVFVTKF